MNIKIVYPGGAGGNWLVSVLNNQVDDNPHPHWHNIADHNGVQARHHVGDWNNYLLLNGSGYFNFFLNHVYKWYHLIDNIYDTDFENYWMKTCAIGKWVCEFASFTESYFDFDALIYQPDLFYSRILAVQKKNHLMLINEIDFYNSRSAFLHSCVSPSNLYNNCDNLYYVAFVLGQLTLDEIYPSFPIGDIANIDLCKQFAFENQSRCKYREYYNIGEQKALPKLV